jgi:hypothetical protein
MTLQKRFIESKKGIGTVRQKQEHMDKEKKSFNDSS